MEHFLFWWISGLICVVVGCLLFFIYSFKQRDFFTIIVNIFFPPSSCSPALWLLWNEVMKMMMPIFVFFFFFIHSFNSMNEFHFVVVQLLLTVAVELFVNS